LTESKCSTLEACAIPAWLAFRSIRLDFFKIIAAAGVIPFIKLRHLTNIMSHFILVETINIYVKYFMHAEENEN
jgi:hypothetical protein